MIELRHLRYFLAIAENSSFTRAAARLRITQPTLSHQIKQLEREIGAQLLDRVGNAVRLTEQGKVFRSNAVRALKEVDAGFSAGYRTAAARAIADMIKRAYARRSGKRSPAMPGTRALGPGRALVDARESPAVKR